MARALRSVVDPGFLTVVVNVGDDTERYGVHVSADPDTVLYTLAGEVSPHGWGRADDTFLAMDEMENLGFDTSFRLGDKDLALCLARTTLLERGMRLSEVTQMFSSRFGVDDLTLLPATDDPLRTWLQTPAGEWIDFQEYFVTRKHADEISAVAYHGAPEASASPGVVEAIAGCDTLVIAPSNPPLSIWPILAIDGIREAVQAHDRTVAVSPLFGGAPLKGPADQVMRGLGLPVGTAGVLAAYEGLIQTLCVDSADRADTDLGADCDVRVLATDTRLAPDDRGEALARIILDKEGP